MKITTTIAAAALMLQVAHLSGQQLTRSPQFPITETINYVGSAPDGSLIGFDIADGIKVLRMDDQGKVQVVQTDLPDDFYWTLRKIDQEFYFAGYEFKKGHYVVEYAKIDLETNKVLDPVKVVDIDSPTDPSANSFSLVSPDKKYFAEVIHPGSNMLIGHQGNFVAKSTIVTVFDRDLKIKYQTEYPFKFSDKEYINSLINLVDNDGSYYSIGAFNKDDKSLVDGVVKVSADGKANDPVEGNWKMDNLSVYSGEIVGDHLVVFGLTGKAMHIMDGTFYVELDKNTFKTVHVNINPMSIDEQLKFTFNKFRRNKIEKGEGVYDVGELAHFVLPDNTIVGVYKQGGYIFNDTYQTMIGSTMVKFFGPTPGDEKEAILALNQIEVKQGIYISHQGAVLLDDVVVFFTNDLLSNSATSAGGEPELYDPSEELKNTATYMYMVDESANVQKEKIAQFSTDAFAFVRAVALNNNRIEVIGRANPDRAVAYPAEKSKTEPRLMILHIK